jgi:uncharacterized protein (TIGR02646 family)
MGLSPEERQRLRAELAKKQGGRCCYCRRLFTGEGDTRPTIEHKKAKMDGGGTDDIANLAAACLHCNAHRGRQMQLARLKARRGTGVPAASSV